jgi:photosynthetic reaction center cytochrome c subunit
MGKEERNMKCRLMCVLAGALAASVLSLLGVALARGQAAPQAAKPPDPSAGTVMSEQYFKNVQLLRGIPVDEFMDTMGMFAASTGMNCTDCHVEEAGGNWAKYADDNDFKQKTRMMIVMMNALNRGSFGGRRMVTCYTCHRGIRTPDVIPILEVQYSTPAPPDPDDIKQDTPGAPPAEQILDKYIAALGGAQRLAGLTTVVGKGTYRAYDDFETFRVELYAKAPNQRSTVQHSAYGDITTTYDGRNAWMAAPQDVKPFPVVALTGGNLVGAGVDATLAFPGRIKQAFTGWHVGPPSQIGDQDVHIVQGNTASGSPVKLYFDEKTGLLLRSVRYSESPVGRVPIRVDYSDYRAVSGIKVPFKWTTTWTDGRSVFELTSVQVNVPVDAARFAKPAPPAPPKTAAAPSR